MPSEIPLLDVEDLTTHYGTDRRLGTRWERRAIRAVDGVSFTLQENEVLGIVGESGSGKSTVLRTLVGLVEATGGSARYRGRDILTMNAKERRQWRREVQMVFQDPFGALDPRMNVRDIIQEAWTIHQDIVPPKERPARLATLLDMVGLDRSSLGRYPHEFSGGQRQRIGIARALAVEPKLLLCDEPVSALDVSVQAQILNLFKDIQSELGVAIVFVGHDLSVVRYVADKVAVMYLGRIVEFGRNADVYDRPCHPYTEALLSAAPRALDQSNVKRRRIVLQGEIPSPANPPSGCRFRTRCWLAEEICAVEEPVLDRPDLRHDCACHFAGERQEN